MEKSKPIYLKLDPASAKLLDSILEKTGWNLTKLFKAMLTIIDKLLKLKSEGWKIGSWQIDKDQKPDKHIELIIFDITA